MAEDAVPPALRRSLLVGLPGVGAEDAVRPGVLGLLRLERLEDEAEDARSLAWPLRLLVGLLQGERVGADEDEEGRLVAAEREAIMASEE